MCCLWFTLVLVGFGCVWGGWFVVCLGLWFVGGLVVLLGWWFCCVGVGGFTYQFFLFVITRYLLVVGLFGWVCVVVGGLSFVLA